MMERSNDTPRVLALGRAYGGEICLIALKSP
jgi:hypothetical protein